MRQAVLLVLPGLSLLCGCQALTQDAEVIDYRPGGVTATTVAKSDASYSLSAPDARRSWIQTDVPEGGVVGFRQEPDGTVVAFAGEQTWRVEASDGRHVWLSTPKPVTGWDKFIARTRDTSVNAFYMTVWILTAPYWIPRCAAADVWP